MNEIDMLNRFNEIDRKLINVEHALRRNDAHISFVTRLYLIFKDPIVGIFSSFGLIKEEEPKHLLDGIL